MMSLLRVNSKRHAGPVDQKELLDLKCPHCSQHFSENMTGVELGWDEDGRWVVAYCFCENEDCRKLVAQLYCYPEAPDGTFDQGILTAKGGRRYYYCDPHVSRAVHPPSINRSVSSNVPEEYRRMFDEACLVLPISPNSSAAISRRCLQHLIRKEFGITRGNLGQEIDLLLKTDYLKPDILSQLHEVREMGNMAAHVWTSPTTCEIVDVEPEHAVALLDIMESILEVQFDAPAELEKRKEKLRKSREGLNRYPEYEKDEKG